MEATISQEALTCARHDANFLLQTDVCLARSFFDEAFILAPTKKGEGMSLLVLDTFVRRSAMCERAPMRLRTCPGHSTYFFFRQGGATAAPETRSLRSPPCPPRPFHPSARRYCLRSLRVLGLRSCLWPQMHTSFFVSGPYSTSELRTPLFRWAGSYFLEGLMLRFFTASFVCRGHFFRAFRNLRLVGCFFRFYTKRAAADNGRGRIGLIVHVC